MKVEPKVQLHETSSMATGKSIPQISARERAIEALMRGNPSTESPAAQQSHVQETAVRNPSSITPEEASAVMPKTAESRQNNTIEDLGAQTPEAETKAAEEPISSQYAVLARKEKALRLRDQQLRAKELAMKAAEDAAKLAATTSQKPAFDESKYVSLETLLQDPFGTLNRHGLGYDKLTDLAMNAPKPEELALQGELRALREEMKALKGDNEATKKSFEEQQSQAYKQAIAQIKSEASVAIRNNPNFETIRETQSLDDVVDLIEQTWKQDGILMTVEDAAQQVEDYLVDEALKIAKIKKIQQRLAPKPSESAPKLTDTPKQQQLKTLTNSVSSTRTLSARERAILAAEGKLNK